jgi:hypothetical protein
MRSKPGRDHRSSDGGVVTQQARNLLMTLADRADGIKFLLRAVLRHEAGLKPAHGRI